MRGGEGQERECRSDKKRLKQDVGGERRGGGGQG